jgi:glycosyltransferase involved in cell wall biosynthesis
MTGRVFVLDPGFGSFGGHNRVANKVLASALAMPFFVLANVRLPHAVTIENATIERHFRVGFYDALAWQEAATGRADIGIWRRLRNRWRRGLSRRSQGDIYHADLARFLAEKDIGSSDHLVVHSAGHLITRPLTRLLMERPRQKIPSLHFRYLALSEIETFDPAEHGRLAELIEMGRAFLYAEMDIVRHHMRAAFPNAQVDLLKLALPAENQKVDRVRRMLNGHAFRILYFGALRDGKGWQRVPDIARSLSNVGDDFRVAMHVGNPWVLARRRNRTVRNAMEAAGIEVLQGQLDDDELSNIVSDADVVILPYRPQDYRLRGSGVALDSIAHGVPMVVSAGCALGEFVADGNGLEAVHSDDFVAAIVSIRKNYPGYVARAERARQASTTWLADSSLPRRIEGGSS